MSDGTRGVAVRLVMTLLVRDEEDILAANLDFHRAAGVDHVVATDNLSEDATPDILEHYAGQGWLTWRRETDDDYSQHRWVTRMAREAAVDHGADWVINNDADEFWLPADGSSLKAVLAQVPPEVGSLRVPRAEFIARPDGPEPFWDRLTLRLPPAVKPDGTRLPPKAVHRADSDVEVAQGNHRAIGPRLGEEVESSAIEVLHVPYRGYARYEAKIIAGGRAYERNRELSPKLGRHWRELYQRYREGGLPDWYAAQLRTEEQVADDLAAGRLVEDVRLRDFFRAAVGD